ncbi:hypothetical protein ASPBRDRAFT_489510 [Aspergillus brasiliensis CBS 101740]|uniref:Uncharacterized protein n=1 Tax=Aspergillus brasiliensis (strain CBS 101740 / IMI 381727 / IBT 21946) TaxID=767769 RepID=A0A1L9U200_ASPBC|nr:hypothetical protein ASPBRDRAFT_489510 [Aspergillus brasiliensis CBS 101740]
MAKISGLRPVTEFVSLSTDAARNPKRARGKDIVDALVQIILQADLGILDVDSSVQGPFEAIEGGAEGGDVGFYCLVVVGFLGLGHVLLFLDEYCLMVSQATWNM